MKNIYIVRHGETEFNKLGIVQGSGVDMPLNVTGMHQAQQFFEAYKHIPFDHVYISSLQRTRQSVNAFLSNGLPYTVLPELNEISWGDFEGKTQSREEKSFYFDVVAKWNAGDEHARVPNGESPFEIQQRQRIAVHHILSKTDEKNILICMHGRAMKSFLCILLNKPISMMENFPHTNLCLYQLTYDGERFHLIKSNDTEHLK